MVRRDCGLGCVIVEQRDWRGMDGQGSWGGLVCLRDWRAWMRLMISRLLLE